MVRQSNSSFQNRSQLFQDCLSLKRKTTQEYDIALLGQLPITPAHLFIVKVNVDLVLRLE